MRKKFTLILTMVLLTNLSFGQHNKGYPQLLDEAQKLFESKEYFKSGLKYSEAIRANGNKGSFADWYNSSSAWSMANYPDSSFIGLLKIANKGNYLRC
jgi:hypothetical protein